MAKLSQYSICRKYIIYTTEYYLKKCTHFGESRYIASTQKLSDSILSDIYFCGVLNVAAFYFSSNLIKTLFSLSITWGDVLLTAKSVSYMSIRRWSVMITKLRSIDHEKGGNNMKFNSKSKIQLKKSKQNSKRKGKNTIWNFQTIKIMKISRCS